MKIILEDWTPGEYMDLIAHIIKKSDTFSFGLKEEYLNCPNYHDNLIIKPDGRFSDEYIDAHPDDDARAYLRDIRGLFNEFATPSSIAELILDKEQLNYLNKERVDLSDPVDTINKLLRHPDVKEVVEYYVGQEKGYFAVKADSDNERFIVMTPENAEIAEGLRDNEDRFLEALSNIEPYKRSRGHYGKFSRGVAGGVVTYIIELLAKPEWQDTGAGYLELILGPSTEGVELALQSLAERSVDFLNTREAMYVYMGALALAFGPELLSPQTRKQWYDRRRSESMDKDKILEILLDE